MRPGLEQAALIPEQGLEMLWLVRPDTAEDEPLVARRAPVRGVELEERQVSSNSQTPVGVRLVLRVRQPLARDREPPRRRRRDGGHRRSLVKRLGLSAG